MATGGRRATIRRRRLASASSSSTARWAPRSRALGLEESHFRGERFAACDCHLKGNNDLLTLTQPQAIEEIHYAYADGRRRHSRDQHLLLDLASRRPTTACRRSSTSSTATARGSPGAPALQGRAHRRHAAASSPARSGPTNRTASISPDVNNPGFRAVTFDDLRDAYAEQIDGADRRRRRPHPDRDDLRHAQRQGGDLRLRGGLREARPCACRS